MLQRWREWLVAVVLVALLGLAYSGVADEYGHRYTEQALKRALLTFAIARGMNGVISVAQGTEVSIEPVGVGVNFTPGQILDPLNDLVEWFSWVMLMAATSLGIQELLLTMLAARGFTWLLVGLSGVVLVVSWRQAPPQAALRGLLPRLLLVLLVARFAVPLMALTGDGLYGAFMQERFDASTRNMQVVTERIGEINRSTESAAQPPADESLFGSAKRLYQSTVSSLDVRAYIDRYQSAAADVSEQVVNLIVVFVVQTILLPLLFLWGLVQWVRWLLFRRPTPGE